MRYLLIAACALMLSACGQSAAPSSSNTQPASTAPLVTQPAPVTPAAVSPAPVTPVAEELTIYRAAGCGCCEKWVEHMQANGFKVKQEVTNDMVGLKAKHNISASASSCHTSLVGGYVIEGHVPAEDVKRLLAEKPQALGLFLPGMPMGSPGMEVGNQKEPYTVWIVGKDGSQKEFAKH